MPSRKIANEYLYGVRLDLSGLEQDIQKAQTLMRDGLSGSSTVGDISTESRQAQIGSLPKSSSFDANILSLTQKIADNVALIAYKLGVSDEDYQKLAKSRSDSSSQPDFDIPEDDEDIELKNEKQDNKKHVVNAKKAWIQVGAMATLAYKFFKKTYETSVKLLNTMSEASNKFISSSSVFVDSNIKSIMATYGVSSTDAQAIQQAQKALKISTSDMATLTSGQRQAFTELMQVYQEGIDSIDADKLEKYNNNIQRYELIKAEFDIRREAAITKLFAESSGLENLINSFERFLDNILNILESPGAQVAMDMFIGFLTSVMDILSYMSVGLSGMLDGKMTTSVTNNNTTNNVSTNISGTSSSNAYAIASEIQKVLL